MSKDTPSTFTPVYCRCGAVLMILIDGVVHLRGEIVCKRCGRRRRWYHRPSRRREAQNACSPLDSPYDMC